MSSSVASAAAVASVDAALASDTDVLGELLSYALDALKAGAGERVGPCPEGPFDGQAAHLNALLGGPDGFPASGVGATQALGELVRFLARGHTDPAQPGCAAHLHCPPLAVAVAADLAVSALNPSLDSWDQGPSAAAAEACLAQELCGLAGYDRVNGGAVMTSGATASMIGAMFLARERARRRGAQEPLRVLCSDHAHFSVLTAADLVDIGRSRVVRVPSDRSGRLEMGSAAAALREHPDADWFVVATAGTTDLGAIDPLCELAQLARSRGSWLHVDAAYGGGLLFSSRRRSTLTGISHADSIALDTHKLGWQPVASGVLLVAQSSALAPFARQIAYLNPPDDESAGLTARLATPMTTTRRADAFKLLVTIRALGIDGLGDLVDRCCDLAAHAAAAVNHSDQLELHSTPSISTVLIRPRCEDRHRRDVWCAELRRRLLGDGAAVLGRTELPGTGPGRRWLKLTLLNPHTSARQVEELIGWLERAVRDSQPVA